MWVPEAGCGWPEVSSEDARGCRKLCRGWSGSPSVFVDEASAVCCSDDSRLLLPVGVWRLRRRWGSLIERVPSPPPGLRRPPPSLNNGPDRSAASSSSAPSSGTAAIERAAVLSDESRDALTCDNATHRGQKVCHTPPIEVCSPPMSGTIHRGQGELAKSPPSGQSHQRPHPEACGTKASGRQSKMVQEEWAGARRSSREPRRLRIRPT